MVALVKDDTPRRLEERECLCQIEVDGRDHGYSNFAARQSQEIRLSAPDPSYLDAHIGKSVAPLIEDIISVAENYSGFHSRFYR